MFRLSSLVLALLALSDLGCSSQSPAPRWPLRALSSDAPQLEQPAFEAPAEAPGTVSQPEAPRIGAPGGSGAGARRVALARD
ncbi:MAG TPA: hypothetical protein VHB79_38495 [Polyangiaceae bacterium]|nr:hypothetical protein [Polyangiaceae bacterium]